MAKNGKKCRPKKAEGIEVAPDGALQAPMDSDGMVTLGTIDTQVVPGADLVNLSHHALVVKEAGVSVYTQTMLAGVACRAYERIQQACASEKAVTFGEWFLEVDVDNEVRLIVPYSYQNKDDVWVTEQIYPTAL